MSQKNRAVAKEKSAITKTKAKSGFCGRTSWFCSWNTFACFPILLVLFGCVTQVLFSVAEEREEGEWFQRRDTGVTTRSDEVSQMVVLKAPGGNEPFVTKTIRSQKENKEKRCIWHPTSPSIFGKITYVSGDTKWAAEDVIRLDVISGKIILAVAKRWGIFWWRWDEYSLGSDSDIYHEPKLGGTANEIRNHMWWKLPDGKYWLVCNFASYDEGLKLIWEQKADPDAQLPNMI